MSKMTRKERREARRNETKEQRRTRKALKSYRCRFLKNFFIWLWGVISFVILLAGGLAITLMVIPAKDLLGQENAGSIADKPLLEAIMNIDTYTFNDIPYAKNILNDLQETDVGDGKKIKDFIKFDFESLNNVPIVQFFDQIDKHIVVVATIDNTVGVDTLGDIGKLSCFTTYREVSQPIDTTSAEFSPKLYYYQNTYGNYVRAYSDDKTLLAPEGSTIYYGALAYLPITDAFDLIDESLSKEKLTDLLSTFGGADLTDDSVIAKILGDKTVGQVGEITDINLDDVLPESENVQLYKILRSATGLADGEKVTLNSLNGLDPNKIELATVLPENNDNKTLYDIIRSAKGLAPTAPVTVGTLNGLDTNKVNLDSVLPESQNGDLYEIIRSAKGLAPTDPVTLGTLNGLQMDNVTINSILDESENAKIYEIIRSALSKPTGDIKLSDLSTLEIKNLDLSVAINETENAQLYSILRSATGIPAGQPITINDLSTLTTDDIELNTVLPENAQNAKLYEIIRSAKGLDATTPITIGTLQGLSTTDIELNVILPESENADIYKIIRSAKNLTASDPITLQTLSGITLENVAINSVLDESANAGIYEIIRSALSIPTGDIKISQLTNMKIENVALSVVLDETENAYLYSIIRSVINQPTGDLTIGSLAGIENFNNLDLSIILDPTANKTLFSVIRSACSLSDSQPVKISSLSSFNVHNINLSTVLILDDNSSLKKVLVDALGDFDSITIGQLATMSFDGVKLSSVILTPSLDLQQLLSELYGKDFASVTMSDLNGSVDIGSIKLSSIIKQDTGNAFLDQVRLDSTATISNIGDKLNKLSLYNIYGQDAFTTDSTKTNNLSAKYVKSIVDGKVVFTLDENGTYYINKSAGVWVLLTFDSSGRDYSTGVMSKYTQSAMTIEDMSSGQALNEKFTNATIRQLIDVGILTGEINPALYGLTISEELNSIS